LRRFFTESFLTDEPLEFRVGFFREKQVDPERVDHETGHDGVREPSVLGYRRVDLDRKVVVENPERQIRLKKNENILL